MGRAVRKVDVEMGDAARLKEVRKIERITRPQPGLVVLAIAALVVGDVFLRPAPRGFRMLLTQLQALLGRCVMNGRLDSRGVAVAETGGRRIDGIELELDPQFFQGKDLRIAEGLRDDGVTGKKIS